jgi:hypothetical protein
MAPRALALPPSYAYAISPSQQLIASVGRKVEVADLSTGLRLPSTHPLSNPIHAAFSHTDSRLAIKNTNGDLAIVDLGTSELVARYKAKGYDEGARVHFSPCDNYVIDGSWSGQIRIRRAQDLQIERTHDFGDEMVTEVSPSANSEVWLFAHQPRTPDGENFAPSPYLTLWRWPLTQPDARVDTGFDNLYAAALNPKADLIALVGHSRPSHSGEIRLLALDGRLLASTQLAGAEFGRAARWSTDSSLLGVVTSSGLQILRTSDLSLVESIDDADAHDMAFLDNNKTILVGTDKKSYLVAQRPSDA